MASVLLRIFYFAGIVASLALSFWIGKNILTDLSKPEHVQDGTVIFLCIHFMMSGLIAAFFTASFITSFLK